MWLRVAERNWLSEDACRNVFGQIYQDRSRPSAGCDAKRLVDATRQLCNVFDHNVPFRAAATDAYDVGFLESIAANGGGSHLTAKDNHRCSVRESVLHRRDHIRSSRTRSDQDHSRLASH